MLINSFKLRALAAFVAGSLMAFAMPPTAWWVLLFLGLGVFYALLNATKGWRSFVLGWLFGFGYFLIGLYWIGNALLVPGNEFKWVWPFTIAGLPMGLAIFTGIAAWTTTKFSDLRTWRGYGVFVVCLMLSEWLRGHILTGFPWNLYGYAWAHELPMVQSVSLFGAYGLTLLTTLWAALPGFLAISGLPARTARLATLASLIGIAGLYTWGVIRLHDHPTQFREDIMIRVAQPSISQEDKWSGRHVAENLKQMVATSSAPFVPGKTYIIVWPETAISDYIVQDINAGHFIRDSLLTGKDPRFLISGTLRHVGGMDKGTRYYNSVVTYDRDLIPVGIYDKSHLVPFGEYIPLKDWIPMQPFVKFSGFTAGSGLKTQLIDGLPPFSGLICYEAIFPGAVAARSPSPAWMVNVTNDGWYGDSAGPYQHLAMTVYRAVEEGIPLVRAANTGISAIIDPSGRALGKIAYNVDNYLDAPLPKTLEGRTAYSKYGDYIFLSVLIFIAGLTRIKRSLSH